MSNTSNHDDSSTEIQKTLRIRVISIPDGDEPEDLRRAWLGLEFEVVPVYHQEKVHAYRSATLRVKGYSVTIDDVMAALVGSHPHELMQLIKYAESRKMTNVFFPVRCTEIISIPTIVYRVTLSELD